MKKLQHHPLAARLPEMTESDFSQLKQSIAAKGGLTDPIVLLDGMILDGRHRDRACEELGIKATYVNYQKSWGDPVEFVISKSSHRNMTTGQKVVVAESFMDDFTQARGKDAKGRSDEYAAMRFAVATQSINRVRQIRKTSPSIYKELRAGLLNVNQAFNRYSTQVRGKAVRKTRLAAESTVALDCKILIGDVIDKLETIPANSVRCIFTDPPYNIGVDYDGDKTGDHRSDQEFIAWCSNWLTECARVLANDGSLFVMMPPRYSSDLHILLTAWGLKYRNTIAWVEHFGAYQEGNFTHCWRPILYFTRTEEFIWNRDARVPSMRQFKYGGDSRANPDGKIPSNVWEASRVQGTACGRVPFAKAPPQLPLSIPEQCILLTTNTGDTVLDPFSGNGTTGIAAAIHGRSYIGIERSKLYAGQSEQWIAHEVARLTKEIK